ncbi:MAG: undecaprenyl-diphosphatase UppP [Ardenticatenaceae bacterium]|nr:undecaprenyl-diphosphatase UppP [Ardenticatenaceae bacterium]MCB9443593.1 undecaprenyl-diphosphatase UppP [Ardenticatenaceae bacterium]
MTIWEAIILGIVQGATEFLPISSSGHLVLVPSIFHWPAASLPLVAIVHQGTLLAVLVYFRRDLGQIIKGVWQGLVQRRPLATPESRLGWFIVAGSIPAGVAGLALESFFEEVFSDPPVAAAFLLVTAVFLITGERLMSGRKLIENITLTDAMVVGIFQMFALFPGVSRSGSTITGGLLRGLNREAAARFSFLLGIPAILGAGLLSGLDLVRANDLASQMPLLVGGFVAAAISGYLCIHFLLTWLRSHSLYLFAAYTAAFSIIYLLFYFLG